jgi:hypothetical protein
MCSASCGVFALAVTSFRGDGAEASFFGAEAGTDAAALGAVMVASDGGAEA